VGDLPGKPDIVIGKAKVAIFCDGDFWHGRNLKARLRKLGTGHNASYWVSKIQSNVKRDRKYKKSLQRDGWLVFRVWESDIERDPQVAADAIFNAASARLKTRSKIPDRKS
jgi:DNA mismatch endonuclease (patch repair protein)